MTDTPAFPLGDALAELKATIDARAGDDPKSSYTAKLLAGGPLLCAKKMGEEAMEAALAAVVQDKESLAKEAADLLYHFMVMLKSANLDPDEVAAVLRARQGTSGIAEKASRSGE